MDIPMCKVKLLDIVNVHDAGTLINPALAEAQVHGGMSMGIGFGLSERLMFDPKTGRALNNNLLDYKAFHLYGSSAAESAVRRESGAYQCIRDESAWRAADLFRSARDPECGVSGNRGRSQ